MHGEGGVVRRPGGVLLAYLGFFGLFCVSDDFFLSCLAIACVASCDACDRLCLVSSFPHETLAGTFLQALEGEPLR